MLFIYIHRFLTTTLFTSSLSGIFSCRWSALQSVHRSWCSTLWKTQTTTNPHYIHVRSTKGAGASLPRDTLPGHLHPRRDCHENRFNRSPSAGKLILITQSRDGSVFLQFHLWKCFVHISSDGRIYNTQMWSKLCNVSFSLGGLRKSSFLRKFFNTYSKP